MNVSKSHRNRHHHYDIPREGKGPSIWEYILTSRWGSRILPCL